MTKPVVAMTCGDVNGIGPEVVLKSLGDPSVRSLCTPILVGPREVFAHYARFLRKGLRLAPCAPVHEDRWRIHLRDPRHDIPLFISSSLRTSHLRPGSISAHAGLAAARAIERAVLLDRLGIVQAIVTAPVSKKALHMAGLSFPGQTEMLQALSSSPSVAMMLVSPTLRVGLATIHVPLSSVPRMLTKRLIRERVLVIHRALVSDWNIPRPRIAVLGLNPHAGEDGDLGTEERTTLLPALRSLRQAGCIVEGPYPADAFFARYRQGSYDAVVAMYHDQGLIPLKMVARGKGVNVSAGLSLVRTSPDHGTAFDIAGSGRADPASMIEAIRTAVELSENRASYLRRHA